MIELNRRCFLALYHDEVNRYIILNDGYFYREFYSQNDEEAIKYFKSLELFKTFIFARAL